MSKILVVVRVLLPVCVGFLGMTLYDLYTERIESEKPAIYESNDGFLHFDCGRVRLIDEQTEYSFKCDFDGSTHEAIYFRTGSASTGCTGVYVVSGGELFKINTLAKYQK